MDTLNYLTIENVTQEEVEKIFSWISIDFITGCWNWTGGHSDGYGGFYFRKKNYAAHRFMYAWLVKPIPVADKVRNKSATFLELDHVVCQNRGCVNPSHLELVTPRVNVLRGDGITAQYARKTHCVNGHLLPDKINRSDGSGRTCKECNRRRAREYQRRQREKYPERQKEYREANKDKINAKKRERRKNNPEIRRKDAEYYQKNKSTKVQS